MTASQRLRRALGLSPANLDEPPPSQALPAPPVRRDRLQELRREVERICRRYGGLEVRRQAWLREMATAPTASAPAAAPRAELPPPVDADGLLYQQRLAAGERLGRQPLPVPGAELRVAIISLLESQGLAADAVPAPEQVLFLDLETTGLSRGAGTMAFIIGLARFEEDGALLVEQILLRDPALEPAALDLLAARLEPARLLVTYNGRGFDVPVLRNRALLCGKQLALERHHLDLLPFSRRLLRPRLLDCRLQSVERELLGLVRVDDLDGAQAPRAYARYLAEGSVEELRRVLEHNRLDVAVLAGLLLALGQRVADPLQWAEDAEELLASGLLALRRGRPELGEACLWRGLELCRSPVTRRRLLAALARQLRRRGRRQEASLLWERHCQEFPEHPAGWLELAKYHEHATRDLSRALELVERAPARPDGQREIRLARLRRRLGLLARS